MVWYLVDEFPESEDIRRMDWPVRSPDLFCIDHARDAGEHSGGGQGLPTSIPLLPTSREDLRLDGYLEYYKYRADTIHSQKSISSPGFEPSPYGTAVSVANHSTGWATICTVTKIFLLKSAAAMNQQ
ncbi:hypothetical protein TNCV_4557231 [Trichonephila clavipes]|nr:hypothetical protein TNCV_4557231 [Trichonephila clavipes]